MAENGGCGGGGGGRGGGRRGASRRDTPVSSSGAMAESGGWRGGGRGGGRGRDAMAESGGWGRDGRGRDAMAESGGWGRDGRGRDAMAESGGWGGDGRGGSSRRDHALIGTPFPTPVSSSGVIAESGDWGEGGGGRGTSRGDGEAYVGENEDKEYLAILISEQEPPQLTEIVEPTEARVQLEYTASGLFPIYLNAGVSGAEASSEFYILETTEDVVASPTENVATFLASPTENVGTFLANLVEEEDDLPETVNVNLNVGGTQMHDHEGGIVMVPPSMIVAELENAPSHPGDLDAFLHEGKWDDALQVLDHMVNQGEAVNGAVEGASEHDVYKAHPELVLWLRGQAYFDMWGQGCTHPAKLYHQGSIANLYPDGHSTGSTVADKNIMPSIRKLEKTGSPLRDGVFLDVDKTRKCVKDYLKVYFPAYRPQLREKDSRVWEFGEKDGDAVRCLVCHKSYRGINVRQLEFHLMGLGQGKQGRCKAVTDYIKQRLEQILADEEVAGTMRKGKQRAAPPPRHLPPPPPPPPPDAAADAAGPSLSSPP